MAARSGERGQAMVEFAIIITSLFMLTVGLIGVALGFYQYNALSAAARYGARWASVVGGTCIEAAADVPTADWCNQYNHAVQASGTIDLNFWTANGSYPVQPPGTKCPATLDTSTSYYSVGDFVGASDTSIVGAIAQRFDTNSGGFYEQVLGSYVPGFDLSQLKVCIQPSFTPATAKLPAQWQFGPGLPVKVVLYYHFQPATGLLGRVGWTMTASSRYTTE